MKEPIIPGYGGGLSKIEKNILLDCLNVVLVRGPVDLGSGE